MTPLLSADAQAWSEATFGTVHLKDQRRTNRVVALAAAMAADPAASLPRQVKDGAALKGSYRLLDNDAVTFEELSRPHWEQTRRQAAEEPVTLLVQDTSDISYSHHPTTTGLGPIGDGSGKGYTLQTVVAVRPTTGAVMGVLYQEPFRRREAPAKENTSQRLLREERESAIWPRAVRAVGAAPVGCTWVHVADRGSDLFDFLASGREQRCAVLLRACQDRRIRDAGGNRTALLAHARRLPAESSRRQAIPQRGGRPARQAHLRMACAAMTLQAPTHQRHHTPIAAWVIRVWEVDAPAGVKEPIEWILVTTVPTDSSEAAWERVQWYTWRWRIEEYHQCLKSGCQIEHRHLRTYQQLTRILGVLAPLAVRLLCVVDQQRTAPDRPAHHTLPAEFLHVLGLLLDRPAMTLTVDEALRGIARLGGYLGRTGDGRPGWKSIWHGWNYLQGICLGVRLAPQFSG